MTHNIMPSSGMRPIIAIIGNTNSGKSTLLNKIVGQDVAIVSAIKGTTTDSVSKNYELTGFGAVSFFDTAGFDDYSELGEKRLKATKRIINRAELVLVVVGKDGLNETIKAEIEELKKRNIEVIFLTQNFMNTDVSVHLRDELFIKLANDFGKIQNEGRLKEYFEGAKALCENCGVEVVDLYSVWEKLYDAKVNVTELLSNKLNHPIREFHYYMAMKIVEKILLD